METGGHHMLGTILIIVLILVSDRFSASVQLQPQLGLRTKRRDRSDTADSDHPAAIGTNLKAAK